ncbi:MAG TPA: carbonic anhydrase [Streptosporangiaceae bacterium]|nr:carbonic anhydrase [Streptosporangiaceae bacterium]
MTRMTPLLERNEQFARTYTPTALGMPARQLVIVSCLDHRADPAIVLGLQLGDAPVIRNAGGRVTQAVIGDIAYLAFLAEQLFGQGTADTLFEVAVIHHTQCGTGFLADPDLGRRAAEATGQAEAVLEASAVADPHVTVRADVERLLASPAVPPSSASPATYTTSPPGTSPPHRTLATLSSPAPPDARWYWLLSAAPGSWH